MLNDHQRRLEIGSHRERLDTVLALGDLHSREAYDLLQIAADDVDPQIRESAERFMRESVWHTGASASPNRPTYTETGEQESFF